MRTLAHVTHEAVHKVGGIGAVLEGLFTSPSYTRQVERTILIAPLFDADGETASRLGPDGDVLYSSLDGFTNHPLADAFSEIRRDYHVEIVYGRRRFRDEQTGVHSNPEVVLIDVRRMSRARVDQFKAALYRQFGIQSHRYENSWDYEQYVRLAEPALRCLEALGAVGHGGSECVVIAHEFMGMPTALAAVPHRNRGFRTVFWAHECAPMRKIVEDHPGHDTMFYNVLSRALAEGQYVEDVFGPQDWFFKFALVEASEHCDNILAVGDQVVTEMRFLGPDFASVPVELAYNGIPAWEVSPEQVAHSKRLMRRYAEILLGEKPDLIFSHVTRMALSKGLWRDIRVMEHLERHCRQTGQTGVLFVLSTELPRRRPEEIYHMERWWNWPVAHREGPPDLTGGEALFYAGVQEFNVRSRNLKIVLVNQFGWDSITCGQRMPEEMEFLDIRRGTDVEFGQSVYEPFGISPLEALCCGAVCVLSSVSGCAGFVGKVNEQRDVPNVIVADYTAINGGPRDLKSLLAIDRPYREEIERKVAARVADQIVQNLPADDHARQAMLARGHQMAARMSWDVVARDYFLPAIDRACRRHTVLEVA